MAEHSGTVRETGLTEVHLRSAEGTTIFLPNRLLHNHALLVTRAENTASVVVTLLNVGDLSPEVEIQIQSSLLVGDTKNQLKSALRSAITDGS